MIRFLLGVAVALGCLWGYDRWWRAPEPAHAEQRGSGDRPGAVDLASDVADGGAAEPTAPSGGTAPPTPDRAAPVAQPSFAALLTAEGAERSRIAAALAERAGAAGGASERLAVLGDDNAFLHSEEGRLVGRRVLDGLSTIEPWEALGAVTGLLERCANGRIDAGDRAARDLVDEVRDAHRELVAATLHSRGAAAAMKVHRVRSGDNLSAIAALHARQLGVPLEHGTLAYLNGIRNPEGIQPGQEVRVPIGAVRVTVWKRSFLLAVYVGDHILRTAWCCHGRPGEDTPETSFVIEEKIERPDWPSPDSGLVPYGHPDNPLGTHFVKLRHPEFQGFGIHGTWEPDSIGTRASAGCVRVANDEVAVLFVLLPRGARVDVRA